MMKKNLSLVLSALVMTFALQSQAGEVAVLGGLDMANMSTNQTLPAGVTKSSISKFTFGLDYNHTFAPSWSVEVGGFYQNKGLKLTQSNVDSVTVGHAFTVPVMVRYAVLPQYLSLGVGAFTSFAIGDLSTTRGTQAATTQTYDAAKMSKLDFGLVGGLRASYPVAAGIDVVGDVRYYLGMKNLNTDTNSATVSQKSTDLAILVGARFAL